METQALGIEGGLGSSGHPPKRDPAKPPVC
jgi:hypothetical protein